MHAASLTISQGSHAFSQPFIFNPGCHSLLVNDLGTTVLPKSSGITQDPILQKLREGDEETYEVLITQYYSAMVRVALQYVSTRAIAEEVVQETWLGFLKTLQRFEGRCSIKTWLFRILTNQAKTRGVQEHRYVPFPGETQGTEKPQNSENSMATLNHDRSNHDSWKGSSDTCEHSDPETRCLAKERITHIESAIQALPPRLRQIIILRDVEGWTPGEVCELLNLTIGNQRVLLHRARVGVREKLEPLFMSSSNSTRKKM